MAPKSTSTVPNRRESQIRVYEGNFIKKTNNPVGAFTHYYVLQWTKKSREWTKYKLSSLRMDKLFLPEQKKMRNWPVNWRLTKTTWTSLAHIWQILVKCTLFKCVQFPLYIFAVYTSIWDSRLRLTKTFLLNFLFFHLTKFQKRSQQYV